MVPTDEPMAVDAEGCGAVRAGMLNETARGGREGEFVGGDKPGQAPVGGEVGGEAAAIGGEDVLVRARGVLDAL